MQQLVNNIAGLHFKDVEKEEDLLFLSRQDYKFLVPMAHLEAVLSFLKEDFFCKAYKGITVFKYHNTYFDTEDYRFFNLHRRGKFKRIKVRIRDYQNGKKNTFIECKRKERGFLTIKQREKMPREMEARQALEMGIVKKNLEDYQLRPDDLKQLTYTCYDRISLRSKDNKTRVSIDFNLEAAKEYEALRPILKDHFILEVKSNQYPKQIIGFLRKELKVQEANFSKYCVSLCVLDPKMKRNKWKQVLKKYC